MCETNSGTWLKEGSVSSFNLRSQDEIEIQSTQDLCWAGGQRHQKSHEATLLNRVQDPNCSKWPKGVRTALLRCTASKVLQACSPIPSKIRPSRFLTSRGIEISKSVQSNPTVQSTATVQSAPSVQNLDALGVSRVVRPSRANKRPDHLKRPE